MKYIYLYLFKLYYQILKFFVKTNEDNVLLLFDFDDNKKYISKEISRSKFNVIELKRNNNIFKKLYYLRKSKIIIVDNFFVQLGVDSFKNQEIIQVWHANGAIKKFGLEKPKLKGKKFYKKIYSKTDKYIVGNDEMKEIFIKSFGTDEKKIFNTGVPRTDFFFDPRIMDQKIDLLNNNNIDVSKKICLYAPTFREYNYDYNSVLNELSKNEDYLIFFRPHPSQKIKIKNPNIIDVSSWDIFNLMIISDLLVTDYSSIPMEYTLLKKPIIYCIDDFKKYKELSGLNLNFDEISNNTVYNLNELNNIIKNAKFDDKDEKFKNKYNKYNVGLSSRKFYEEIICLKEYTKIN